MGFHKNSTSDSCLHFLHCPLWDPHVGSHERQASSIYYDRFFGSPCLKNPRPHNFATMQNKITLVTHNLHQNVPSENTTNNYDKWPRGQEIVERLWAWSPPLKSSNLMHKGRLLCLHLVIKLGETHIKLTDIFCGMKGASGQKNWFARKILKVKQVTNANTISLTKRRQVKLDVYGSCLSLCILHLFPLTIFTEKDRLYPLWWNNSVLCDVQWDEQKLWDLSVWFQ